MKVRDVMKKEVKTVSRDAAAREAYEVMKEAGFRHMPVVDGGKLVGILSDRDLRLVTSAIGADIADLSAQDIPEDIKVGRIMTADPAILVPDTDLRQAVSLMIRHKIGALPVVEKGKLVGIVTQIDLLKLLVDFLKK